MLGILRGDDTDFKELRTVYITLQEVPFSLDGCTGRFTLCGQTCTLTNLVANTEMSVVFSGAQTSEMRLGVHCATFKIVDANGKIRTIDSSVRVLVSDSAEEVYGVTRNGNGVILNASVSYAGLSNKPKLNGVELVGNVRIPVTVGVSEPPDTETEYAAIPTGMMVGDGRFDVTTGMLYIFSKVGVKYKWIGVTGKVAWANVVDRPFEGSRTIRLKSQDDLIAAVANIIKQFGGRVNV